METKWAIATWIRPGERRGQRLPAWVVFMPKDAGGGQEVKRKPQAVEAETIVSFEE